MSQPYYKDPLLFETFSQEEPLNVTRTTVGRRLTSEEQSKIQIFDENIDRYREEISEQNREIQSKLEELNEDNAYEIERKGLYYYFIGRLNPPHEGHIEALLNVISNAIDNKGIAIILLGSGPNGGERTSKDPLNFEIKRNFVIDKLKDKLKYKYPGLDIDEMFVNGRIQISEMGKTTEQIRSVIQNDIGNQLFEELEAIRISGDKDGGEDLKKLAWIEKALSAGIIDRNGNIIPLTAHVLPQPAVQSESKGEPMSATIIRKIVYDMDPFTNYEDRLKVFKDETRGFYETRALDHTKLIFDAIDMYNPHKEISGSDKTAKKVTKTRVSKLKIGGRNTRRKLRKTKCKLSRRRKLTKQKSRRR
jgi:nicotinamide mononucleotide adenylyltransferase